MMVPITKVELARQEAGHGWGRDEESRLGRVKSETSVRLFSGVGYTRLKFRIETGWRYNLEVFSIKWYFHLGLND